MARSHVLIIKQIHVFVLAITYWLRFLLALKTVFTLNAPPDQCKWCKSKILKICSTAQQGNDQLHREVEEITAFY